MAAVLHPCFNGDGDINVIAVGQVDAQSCGKNKLAKIGYGDIQAFVGISLVNGSGRGESHVELPVIEVPAAPELAEIFAAGGVHLRKKSKGDGYL